MPTLDILHHRTKILEETITQIFRAITVLFRKCIATNSLDKNSNDISEQNCHFTLILVISKQPVFIRKCSSW